MKNYWYVLNLNPVQWKVGPVHAKRSEKTGKLGGGVGRDQELAMFQEAVRAGLAELNPVKIDGKFTLEAYFWRNMTEYKTSQSRTARNQEADGTNLYKALEDACAGILFGNDKDNKFGRFHVVDQGPHVEGMIVIMISEWSQRDTDAIVQLFPDEVHVRAFGSAHEQLQLGLAKPNEELAAEDSKYALGQEIF